MALKDAPQSNKQHAVPQNIMEVEFKLIGDLTMRQFSYLLVFGLFAYISYLSIGGVFKWPLILGFTLIGLAFAFLPIQERGLDEWTVNFIRAVYSPTQRIWQKELTLPSAFTYQNLDVVQQELITLAPTSSRRKLEQYLGSHKQSNQEDVLDIKEKDYILKVRKAFAGVTTTAAPAMATAVAPPTATVITDSQEPLQPKEDKKDEVSDGKDLNKDQKADQPLQETPEVKVSTLAVQQAPPPPPQAQPVFSNVVEDITLDPITPDMHSGRKFTRMLPSEGRLILPVRGEKILSTSDDELEIQEDIQEKTAQLNKLLEQIKTSTEKGPVKIDAPSSDHDSEISKARNVVKDIKKDNERLTGQIAKVQKELSQADDAHKKQKEEELKKLEQEKQKASSTYTALQQKLRDLQHKLSEKNTKQEEAEKSQPPARPQGVDPTTAQINPLTTTPNIVSGIVRGGNDNAGVSDLVLLIKNHRGESVRAVKTNSIGQFSISTPLDNGMYTIEVASHVEGLTFDIITVEVKGEVLPPIDILGKTK